MVNNGNGILKGKITLKEFFAAVGILGAIAFAAFTYINDKDVQLDAVVLSNEALAESISAINEKNEKQDEEIIGAREGIGFIKGQLSALITQLEKLELQNDRILRRMKIKRKAP